MVVFLVVLGVSARCSRRPSFDALACSPRGGAILLEDVAFKNDLVLKSSKLWSRLTAVLSRKKRRHDLCNETKDTR
jgi:hypothetical protein